MSNKFYSEAISRLSPGCGWGLSPADELNVDASGNITNLNWNEGNPKTPPTKAEIIAEAAIVQAEYTANLYKKIREREYPPLADLADALYWQQQGDETKMTAYFAAIAAVKTKYPKG
jgi:hypothetical protein